MAALATPSMRGSWLPLAAAVESGIPAVSGASATTSEAPHKAPFGDVRLPCWSSRWTSSSSKTCVLHVLSHLSRGSARAKRRRMAGPAFNVSSKAVLTSLASAVPPIAAIKRGRCSVYVTVQVYLPANVSSASSGGSLNSAVRSTRLRARLPPSGEVRMHLTDSISGTSSSATSQVFCPLSSACLLRSSWRTRSCNSS
eukprot:scaffold99423_cov28-Tisochrysis_lutea.AAC.6